jgi:branched-chain amino acid transport system ATP-binding protein
VSLLSVERLEAAYGPVKVLHGIDFEVGDGETAVILGANGAGKTTTLRALSGMVTNHGKITFDGHDITHARTDRIVRMGVAHVPQGRGTFVDETVEENLLLGAYTRRQRSAVGDDIDRVYELFPRLRERTQQPAGSLSGGEQQMLAIARGLMMRPRLMLLDEPSLGLAPIVVQELFRALADLKREDSLTMLIVEQNANLAFDIADRAHVLEAGTVAVSGPSAEIRADEGVRRAYLGY